MVDERWSFKRLPDGRDIDAGGEPAQRVAM